MRRRPAAMLAGEGGGSGALLSSQVQAERKSRTATAMRSWTMLPFTFGRTCAEYWKRREYGETRHHLPTIIGGAEIVYISGYRAGYISGYIYDNFSFCDVDHNGSGTVKPRSPCQLLRAATSCTGLRTP